MRARSVVWPVAVVGVVLVWMVTIALRDHAQNVTGLITFGRAFTAETHPPPHALVNEPIGYDGQFFWLQANDPLVLSNATIDGFRAAHEGFRLGRMAYPALSYALAAGDRSAIPWSMLLVNVVIVLATTTAFAVYARRRGWSTMWAVAIGLMPGMLLGTLRDLSDPLAIGCMLGGLLCWQHGRRWPAGAFLAAAVLARETMLLAVLAIVLYEAASWWMRRRRSGGPAGVLRTVWPAVVPPVLALLAWQAYVDLRFGGNVLASTRTPELAAPFTNFVDEIHHALVFHRHLTGAWSMALIALVIAGIVASLALVRRRLSVPALAAALFALALPVLTFGDPWSYGRLSAPMFVALLLASLQQRWRPGSWLCAAPAAMALLIPIVLYG